MNTHISSSPLPLFPMSSLKEITAATDMMSVVIQDEMEGVCFLSSIILNDLFNLMKFNSKMKIGYMTARSPSGISVHVRHTWVDVIPRGTEGYRVDPMVSDYMMGMISYSYEVDGEYISLDPIKMKAHKNLEESLKRYKDGVPLKKCLSPKGYRQYIRIRDNFMGVWDKKVEAERLTEVTMLFKPSSSTSKAEYAKLKNHATKIMNLANTG